MIFGAMILGAGLGFIALVAALLLGSTVFGALLIYCGVGLLVTLLTCGLHALRIALVPRDTSAPAHPVTR
ncbi:MAG: hypothetical protein AAF672_01580 [Pseudomonadota bacterium]